MTHNTEVLSHEYSGGWFNMQSAFAINQQMSILPLADCNRRLFTAHIEASKQSHRNLVDCELENSLIESQQYIWVLVLRRLIHQ